MKTVQAVKSERFLKPAWTDDGKQDITKGHLTVLSVQEKQEGVCSYGGNEPL